MSEILNETMFAFKRTQMEVKDNMYLFYDGKIVILGEQIRTKEGKSK